MSMLITLAISYAIQGLINLITDLANKQKELREAALEFAHAREEQNKAIDEYKSKISVLKTALGNGNLSLSDAYSARTELTKIQDELIEKYGLEAASINLVNGELQFQLDLLDRLTKKSAKNWLQGNCLR